MVLSGDETQVVMLKNAPKLVVMVAEGLPYLERAPKLHHWPKVPFAE